MPDAKHESTSGFGSEELRAVASRCVTFGSRPPSGYKITMRPHLANEYRRNSPSPSRRTRAGAPSRLSSVAAVLPNISSLLKPRIASSASVFVTGTPLFDVAHELRAIRQSASFAGAKSLDTDINCKFLPKSDFSPSLRQLIPDLISPPLAFRK